MQTATETQSPLFERRWKAQRRRASDLQQEITRLQTQNRLMRKIIFTDPLTELCNRMALERALIPKWSEHSRGAVIALDIDRFKSINDGHGHPVGDRVIQAFGHIIRCNIRSEDLAARYGGEEFVVLLQNGTIEEATVVAERIRKATERHTFPNDLRVTVSGGIACGEPIWNELFPRADQALYRAKSQGRNRIVSAAPIAALCTAAA